MAKVRISWDDGNVKSLRVSVNNVRVPSSGTEKTLPDGLVGLFWHALGTPGSAFSITIIGLDGTVVLPAGDFPCPGPPVTRKLPPQRTQDFGVCTYTVKA
jgi:hypothetical protein